MTKKEEFLESVKRAEAKLARRKKVTARGIIGNSRYILAQTKRMRKIGASDSEIASTLKVDEAMIERIP